MARRYNTNAEARKYAPWRRSSDDIHESLEDACAELVATGSPVSIALYIGFKIVGNNILVLGVSMIPKHDRFMAIFDK
jgi:hypothetical protein